MAQKAIKREQMKFKVKSLGRKGQICVFEQHIQQPGFCRLSGFRLRQHLLQRSRPHLLSRSHLGQGLREG